MATDAALLTLKLSQVFDDLSVEYYVGGSIASSIHGEPRSTKDADFIARLIPNHARPIATALQTEYYVDENMVREAIETHSSFNIIHLETLLKADIFVPRETPWTREQFARRQLQHVDRQDAASLVYVASPEDVILQKLDWFRQTGGTSDTQWRDVLGILKVKASTLDYPYLHQWGVHLGIPDLLEQALKDAGISGEKSIPRRE